MSGPVITWRRTAGFGHPEVFALIGLLSFAVARFVPVLALHTECPLRAMAGIPCATCGMTHAFVHLAHGRLAAALAASPAGALLAAAAWAYAVLDLVRAAAGWPLPVPSPRLVRAGAALGVVVLLASWAFVIAREGAAS